MPRPLRVLLGADTHIGFDLHVLDRPRTLSLTVAGTAVSVVGFPCARQHARARFPGLLAASGWQRHTDPVRLLCVHQTFEGSQVGPVGYTFRLGSDVLRGRDIPAGFAAVLAGHIHRHQVLTHDLAGRPLAAPVVYPGSVERTSRAERHEVLSAANLRRLAPSAMIVEARFVRR